MSEDLKETRPSVANGRTDTLPSGINKKLIEAVEVKLDALLGQAHMRVAELTGLDKGAIVPLDATIADSVELRLNGAPIARGELVTVGDNFAVRLTEITS